jgi:hypothetical protein
LPADARPLPQRVREWVGARYPWRP